MLICLDQRNGNGCGATNADKANNCQHCGMSLRFALVLQNPGTLLGVYQIGEVIGYGGFGAVYEAKNTQTGKLVALKESFDPASIRAFRGEFAVLHRLNHDHLPHYDEMFEAQGNGYLVMELIPGQSLLDVLQRGNGKPLAEAQVLGYAVQVCDALAYLHTQHPVLIHRDIKPANIRLTPDGLIKLVDFGLLKQGTNTTRPSRMGLTPAYAPLEQLGGTGMHTSPQSDLYSLGATLYHLLTGQPPLMVHDRLAKSPDPLPTPKQLNPRLSTHMSNAIIQALEIQPQNRFADATSFKRALMSADHAIQQPPPQPMPAMPAPATIPAPVDGIPTVPAYTPPSSPPASSSLGWLKGVGALVVVGLLLLLGAGVWVLGNEGKDDTVAKQPAVVVEPTNTPTPKPTNTPTPEPTNTPTAMPLTNPLYPTTLDEWRNETSRLSRDFTREGDHYWRYVSGNTYTIGGWTDDENDDNDAQADVALPDYWIAKYPVTNQQYRQIIATGGYDNEDYWTPNGWAWKKREGRTQPFYWDYTKYNRDEQPVVGVTWYEATAYANWLNAQLAGTLPGGYQVQLPTEAAWEVVCAYAANGQRYRYPWGEVVPNAILADFGKDWRTNGASRVGGRPDGAAACGAQDMVGTVWEAMSSSYAGYAAASGTTVADFRPDNIDVPYQGGAWYSSDTRNITRCAARDGDYPGYPDDDYNFMGFRLVLLP